MDFQSILIGLSLAAILWLLRTVSAQSNRIKDMHDWMSPDDTGRQPWKDMSPILRSIEKTHEQLDRLCCLLERQLDKD